MTDSRDALQFFSPALHERLRIATEAEANIQRRNDEYAHQNYAKRHPVDPNQLQLFEASDDRLSEAPPSPPVAPSSDERQPAPADSAWHNYWSLHR